MTSPIEETLVLVKPDGVARNLTGEILRRIEAKGYSLVDIRTQLKAFCRSMSTRGIASICACASSTTTA